MFDNIHVCFFILPSFKLNCLLLPKMKIDFLQLSCTDGSLVGWTRNAMALDLKLISSKL